MGDMNSAMREQVMLVVLLVLGLGETVPEHRESRASLRTLAEAAINAISNSVPGARQDSTTDSTTEPGVTTPSQADDVMGCRPDFFQVGDSCFYVSRNLLARNWVEAQIACMEMNSTLASVTSKEELQSIQSNCSYIGKFFLGGTDSGSENNWKWSGGAEWEFENWRLLVLACGMMLTAVVLQAGVMRWDTLLAATDPLHSHRDMSVDTVLRSRKLQKFRIVEYGQ